MPVLSNDSVTKFEDLTLKTLAKNTEKTNVLESSTK